MLRIKNQKAQSVIEYMTMLVIILFTILVFQKYILRAIDGRWKQVGDSFGYGRQYDPKKTFSCKFDYVYTNSWYSDSCFKGYNCHCDRVASNPSTCEDCIKACQLIYEPVTNTMQRLCDN